MVKIFSKTVGLKREEEYFQKYTLYHHISIYIILSYAFIITRKSYAPPPGGGGGHIISLIISIYIIVSRRWRIPTPSPAPAGRGGAITGNTKLRHYDGI